MENIITGGFTLMLSLLLVLIAGCGEQPFTSPELDATDILENVAVSQKTTIQSYDAQDNYTASSSSNALGTVVSFRVLGSDCVSWPEAFNNDQVDTFSKSCISVVDTGEGYDASSSSESSIVFCPPGWNSLEHSAQNTLRSSYLVWGYNTVTEFVSQTKAVATEFEPNLQQTSFTSDGVHKYDVDLIGTQEIVTTSVTVSAGS